MLRLASKGPSKNSINDASSFTSMQMNRLKWLALVAPILFLGVLEYARYAFHPVLDTWTGRLLMDGVILGCAIFFYGAVFTVMSHMQRRLELSNRELLALRSASLAIGSDLSLQTVLQKVVDQARHLIGTHYGAISVIDDDGRIEAFITSGVALEARRKIGDPPTGKGLLGVVLREGQRLRLDDIHQDPRSFGFPSDHPQMHSLLAVPVICRGPFRGNLYLSEKVDKTEMTQEEEETLARFATHAAIAIDNAHLHSQVRNLAVAEERSRIAHEMHDGQAQVLAYVNTKAQAVLAYLEAGKVDDARQQLEQLAAAARQVLVDVREGILGLRIAAESSGISEKLHRHVELWRDQNGVHAELEVDGEPDLTPEIELQLIRIVQEAMTNIRKHARAERVLVNMRLYNADEVRIQVEDDGVGFHSDHPARNPIPRFGLATMRERAEAIGATLTIESTPSSGTRVEVYYPGRDPIRKHAESPKAEQAVPVEAE